MSRTLVVGFDGAVLDLCQQFQAEGGMPALASIAADGSYGEMRSVFPYNSAVAWTSLATGVNPGRHGVFDFVLPRQDRYELRVATVHDRRVPALWNYASDSGARVAIINIPKTWPAEPVTGLMVSGMDAPSLEDRAVHPPELLEEIHRLQPDYRIISKAAIRAEHGDFEAAERELIDVVAARGRLVAKLAAARDFDLLMVNLEATDGSHHFFWQHFDPSHPRHDPTLAGRFGGTIRRVYEAVDHELARLIDAYAPDTVFVVSDHGGGPSNDWVLYMNDWLAAEGFLAIRPKAGATLVRKAYAQALKRMSVPLRRRLRPLLGRAIERAKGLALYGDVNWSSSRAYGTVESMVRLNLRGREPEGIVSPEERDGVIEELLACANRSLSDGRRVFVKAAKASDVFQGEVPGGPDVVAEPASGTQVRGRNSSARPGFLLRLEDLGVYYPSGVHTPIGMVAAAGSGVTHIGRVERTDIHRVAPSVLAVMGVEAPTLDGEPFDFVTRPLLSTGQSPPSLEASLTELAVDEEAEVLERLRGLGYVD
jgi:predicted AlkP superfamily phosphohydrolase/phosphomutase